MQKWGVGIAVVLCALPLCAATFFGKIKSVDAEMQTVVVEASKSGGTKTFTLNEKSNITLNGKKSDFDSLVEGVNVTVSTDNSNKVTRINIKPDPVSGTREKTNKKPSTSKSSSADQSDATTAEVSPSDWTYFNGANHDNISHDTGLLKSWPENGPPEAWSAEGLGEGYSAVTVAGGLVFTMGNVQNSETVTALDLATGEKRWQQKTAGASRLQMGNGPRGTPTYDNGNVYALGGNGDLSCLDAETGKQIWRKNILQEFNGRNIQWGISESVLIDGDRLICSPGGDNGTVVALNKKNGKVLWRCMVPGKSMAGYSSAIIADIDGVKQYIQFLHVGLVGIRAENGEFLWGNNDSANGTANCSSPVFANNMVFSASGYGKGGAMVKLTGRGKRVEAKHVYHTNNMESHHGGLVLLDGHVYGSSDPGVLRCLDLATGDVKWENRSVGKGSITCADGNLYVRSERGPIALVEANPGSYIETGRFDQPNRSDKEAWAHPVIAQGKLFLRDQGTLLVYDIKQK